MALMGADKNRKERVVSQELLLGLTLGAYATAAILYTPFGGLMVTYWEAPIYPVSVDQPAALVFLIPGIIVFGLGFLQVRLRKAVENKLHDRVTSLALWLNTLGAAALCLFGPFKELVKEFPERQIAIYVMYTLLFALACIPAGIVVSVCNLGWSGFRIVKHSRVRDNA
jgi:hypothetical protein